MGRRWRSREEECESERVDGAGKAVIFLSSDDEEANEDLSLAIVNKARLREAKRKRAEDKEKAQAFFVDLSISSADEIDAVTNGKAAGETNGFLAGAVEEVKKKRKKRPKKKKKEKEVEEEILTEQPDFPAEEDDPVGTSDSVIEDPNETADNLVLRKLLRGPRYFDPGHGSWETCYNCGEEGHIAANCKEERRQRPCFVCGMLGHNAKHCMQGQECFICKRRGHHAKECPDKYKSNSQESILCLRCGDIGHDMASCRSNYAHGDIKEIQCYICKKYGHLCCVDYKDKGPSKISCYNCAESGHTGQGCAKQRSENTSTTPPTLCYRCGQEGHIARGCTKNQKFVKRYEESSTPANRMKVKKDYKVSKSLPRDFEREHKRESPYFYNSTRAVKPKIKGGWIVDDTGYLPNRKLKTKDWASPSTPSGRIYKINSSSGGRYSSYSSPRTPHKMHNNYYAGTPSSRGFTGVYHNGFSASRFSYSHGFHG